MPVLCATSGGPGLRRWTAFRVPPRRPPATPGSKSLPSKLAHCTPGHRQSRPGPEPNPLSPLSAPCPAVEPRRCGMDIRLKRAYDEAAPDDGFRALIDGLWPRGVSREQAAIDAWLKELAPSPGLRRWFGHRSEERRVGKEWAR